MTPDLATRMRYARAIRAMSSPESAAKLLTAYAVECTNWPAELTELEQLPDWRHGTLLAAAATHVSIDGLCAADTQALAEYYLLGMLSRAILQALGQQDVDTATRLSAVCNRTMLVIRGGGALEAALGDLSADDGAP